MKKYKIHWLFCFLILSLIFGVIFKVAQISLQSNLHDPLTYEAVNKAWEVALSQEANNGQLKAPFLRKVDVANNLDSFMTVYDRDKKVIGSSGVLDGKTPDLPHEFLNDTSPYMRNYFQWTPKEDVHLAGVTVAIGDDGYVLAGRNMQEAYRQGNRAIKSILLGWAGSVVLMTVAYVVLSRHKR
jgi:hypothetical protein